MGTFSFVCSVVCLAPDVCVTALVPGWQALEMDAEMSGTQSLPVIKAILWGIEMAVECGAGAPECT